ncbi:MAG: permease prefix domain 1-containing protein [Defluviitaleaceae bacterium]|nr:permease prefix domain 1-containing protein [Defluviitaleaceae bacterium]
MNEQRISKLVNDLFYDVVENDRVREQKEELRIHLAERVNDYMAAGLSFDEALQAAKDGLGDPEELINGFERKRAVVLDNLDEDYGVNIQFRFNRLMAKLVPLAPFVYIILGVTQSSWYPEWWVGNWWAWGWVIIPITAIVSSGIGLSTITALAPFIYIYCLAYSSAGGHGAG